MYSDMKMGIGIGIGWKEVTELRKVRNEKLHAPYID
jgi:hypothetical protein